MVVAFITLSSLAQKATPKSIYDYKVRTVEGETYDFSQLKGKKVMIVNTASRCGYTKQYDGLQELYAKYGPDKFVLIAFPANDFMRQEPGSNEEIKNFCEVNFGVTFPLMAKIHVKGEEMHPLYEWLTKKKLNGVMNSKVKWNFQKYLIDENGKIVKVIDPATKPSDREITDWLQQ